MAATRPPQSDLLPLPRHRLLLTALLCPPAIARPAALKWLDSVDFDLIDVGEERLMPFFDSRLREFGINHPTTGRVRGLYRRAWYLEQMMHSQLGGVLKIIGEVTSEAVLLKGAALGRIVYDRPVHRPYDDFDILVPYDMQVSVVEAMRRAGGTVCPPSFHATTVRMPSGLSVDIHRSPYHLAFQAKHVKPLFMRLCRIEPVAPATTGSRYLPPDPWFTLSSTDHFLHTLMHGLAITTLPPIRWIVDAALLLRREGCRIDWDLLVAEVARLDFVEPAIFGMREVLVYEPNEDAASVLAELERRTSQPATLYWDVDAKLPQVVWIRWLWEATRRNAGNPVGRLRLIVSLLLAQHGWLGLFRRLATKGVPVSIELVKTLFMRRLRMVRRCD
jgi:hypothetical protein